MAYFPLFVNLKGKEILLIGGGPVAERRVKALLSFDCRLTVVAPEATKGIQALSARGALSWKEKAYENGDLDAAPFFVVAAAGEEVNRLAAADCRSAGIPVNDASKKENCDFYFPGIVKDGDVVLGVTSGGENHRLAARLCAALRDFLKEFRKKTGPF